MTKINSTKIHNLGDFLERSAEEIKKEYDRVSKRTKEDPGTAGDQAEENWACIIRSWIPSYFTVVTKGRIIFENNEASPQIDILVLSPDYPKILIDKGDKLYISSGVIAAFECKLNLDASHFSKFFETSEFIKSRFIDYSENTFDEIKSPFFYGLLAHMHSWKEEKSNPTINIEKNLIKYASLVHLSKFLPDLICVNDLNTWFLDIMVQRMYDTKIMSHTEKILIRSSYQSQPIESSELVSITVFLIRLLHRLSLSFNSIKPIVRYFGMSNIHTKQHGGTIFKEWEIETLSLKMQQKIRNDSNFLQMQLIVIS